MICDGGRSQVFHVISRVVDKNFIFEEEEKGQFLGMMRRLESFSGVEVLSYCLMSNHFHILLHVPEKPEVISDEEVMERMQILYGEQKFAEFEREIAERKEMGDMAFEKELYEGMRKRMYDLSSYVRDLKLRFSKWFNAKMDRKGTLWEDRFRSVLVEPSESAMVKVAAYIELNPVRAELVSQPHEYKWCSFTEAVAGGDRARSGITKVVAGLGGAMKWEKVTRLYRSYFLYKAASQNHDRKGVDQEEFQDSMHHEGDLSEIEKLQTRLRYFTEGAVIGGLDFLSNFLKEKQSEIGDHRKRPGYKMGKGENGIYSYRKVE